MDIVKTELSVFREAPPPYSFDPQPPTNVSNRSWYKTNNEIFQEVVTTVVVVPKANLQVHLFLSLCFLKFPFSGQV